jgi:cytochrome c2
LAKPLELTSLKWPFVALAALLALATVYAVWDEARARRPWKTYQEQFQRLSERRLRADVARAEKRLDAPEAKKQLEAARAELAAAEAAIGGSAEQRKAYEALRAAEERAKVAEAEAKLYLGFEKSKADGLYYQVREARHEGSAEEKALLATLDGQQQVIGRKAAAYAQAREAREKATAARAAVEKRATAARARLEALEKPVRELRAKLDAATGLGAKGTELTQYWVRAVPNSWGSETVDRCHVCHVSIDKAGLSTPAEVLDARKAGLPAKDLGMQYAVDDEVMDGYQAVHDRICEEVALPSPVTPFGGHPKAEPPPPVDPARATECRPVETYRRWLALSAAYCGSGDRALARTGFLLRDAKGAPVERPHRLAPRVQDFEGHGHEARHEADDDGLAGVASACAPKALVTAFEQAQKADTFDVPPVFRTHPRRAELLTKAHPPEKFGCSVCHGGQGAQTKGVMHREFRHGADDHDWNDPLTEEVRVLGAKQSGAFLQAKCDKCHREELTVNRAPLLTRGKKLFVEIGCWGCHPIEGYSDLPRRGPQLTNLVSKTTPGWVERWISYPRGWRPATRMPNFWPGAVEGTSVPRIGGETPEAAKARHEKVRADEVSQIAAYLWVTSTPARLPPMPARAGSAERGKALFDSVGCRACHVAAKGATARRSEASPDRDYAPNLWNVGDKARPEWIYGWIKNPRAQWSETKMPDLRLSDEEAADVTAYLSSLRSGETYPAPAQYADRKKLEALAEGGKKLVNKYGCFGCHVIKGFENAQKIATELTEHGRKDPRLLDFGDVRYFTEEPKHRETYANFVWTKLHTPRIFGYESVETRMPQFDFSDDEALALLTFLKGQTGERSRMPREVLPGLDGPKLAVLTGERFVFWNGCRNCHELERRGAVVRDLFNEETMSYAPPIITGEGAKVQPSWLFGFLKGPTPLRPWLSIRMPTFHFADEDATRLVEYFAASSGKSFPYLTVDVPPPSREKAKETIELFTALQCTKCHVVGKLAPNQDPASAAPDFLLAKKRLRPDWIPLWLTNPNALMEGTRMPSFWDPDPDAPAPHPSFGGDKAAQREALRDLLMHLGEPGYELAPAPKRRVALAAPR